MRSDSRSSRRVGVGGGDEAARLDPGQLEHAPSGVERAHGLRQRPGPANSGDSRRAAQVRARRPARRIATGGGGSRAARSRRRAGALEQPTSQPQVDGQTADAGRAPESRAAWRAPRPGRRASRGSAPRARTSPARRRARRPRATPPLTRHRGPPSPRWRRAPRGSRPRAARARVPRCAPATLRDAAAPSRRAAAAIGGEVRAARSRARRRRARTRSPSTPSSISSRGPPASTASTAQPARLRLEHDLAEGVGLAREAERCRRSRRRAASCVALEPAQEGGAVAEALGQPRLLGAAAGEHQVQPRIRLRARRSNASASRSMFFSLVMRPA